MARPSDFSKPQMMEGMVEAKQGLSVGDVSVECGRVGGRVRL